MQCLFGCPLHVTVLFHFVLFHSGSDMEAKAFSLIKE